jgi:hypothetical protein
MINAIYMHSYIMARISYIRCDDEDVRCVPRVHTQVLVGFVFLDLYVYVCFVARCFSFCYFSIGHCVVCPSLNYVFWLVIGIFKLSFYFWWENNWYFLTLTHLHQIITSILYGTIIMYVKKLLRTFWKKKKTLFHIIHADVLLSLPWLNTCTMNTYV